MKNYKLTLLLTCLCFPFALISQIQGDGSLQKPIKRIIITKQLIPGFFYPRPCRAETRGRLYDNSGRALEVWT